MTCLYTHILALSLATKYYGILSYKTSDIKSKSMDLTSITMIASTHHDKIAIQLISHNRNPVNRNFRKRVGCEALAPIQDNGSL